jgi:hypothetical protein
MKNHPLDLLRPLLSFYFIACHYFQNPERTGSVAESTTPQIPPRKKKTEKFPVYGPSVILKITH